MKTELFFFLIDNDDGQGRFARSNSDAIYRQRRLLNEFSPDLLLV